MMQRRTYHKLMLIEFSSLNLMIKLKLILLRHLNFEVISELKGLIPQPRVQVDFPKLMPALISEHFESLMLQHPCYLDKQSHCKLTKLNSHFERQLCSHGPVSLLILSFHNKLHVHLQYQRRRYSLSTVATALKI